jgi:ribosomal protein L20
MTRVKRGLMTRKRHNNLLAKVKGFRMMNGNVFSRAKNALAKA